ncbi:hypothetical protein H0H87_008989 [Tephrocybe sp. NHM501043]|nr:hypothetical protein H0H87_008989 [Tephrocybe sp. NHM501043]
MIISSALTIGQITFILRVAIQILTYISLAVLGTLILGNAPRVASLKTHDTINRIVGANSATSSTIKWLFNSLRRNPSGSSNLILILFFSLSYTIFASLSDIGFLGFYACSVPGPTTFDHIASLTSSSSAENFIRSYTVNGTDLSAVRTYHCDASAVAQFDLGTSFYNCTSWSNSTLSDNDFYEGLNGSDTDALMLRQLTHRPDKNDSFFNFNTFYIGPTPQLVLQPIINGGLAIVPHPTGVRMVAGVPQLEPNTQVELSDALALEMDVGCMTLGVVGVKNTYDISDAGNDFMRTRDGWRKYTGPDYMQDVLAKTVDDIRTYLQPFFNVSSMDGSGMIQSFNSTNVMFSPAANINSHRLLRSPTAFDMPDTGFMANCTAALQQKLGIPNALDQPGTLCSLLGMGGSRAGNGALQQGFDRMVCAASTQLNLVDATIHVNENRNVSLDFSRIPSALNYVYADFWTTETRPDNGSILFDPRTPYERYTLTPDSKSPSTHFIAQSRPPISGGQGSAGNAITSIVPFILEGDLFRDNTYAGMTALPEGFEDVIIGTERLVEWAGQVGGSYILGSLVYNGWAALDASRIKVVSTGGRIGSCYKPYYAIGFIPLVLSAGVVFCWAVILLFGGSLFGTGKVKDAYGGLSTYSAAMCPGAEPSATLVVWESAPEPHLRPLSDGYPLTVNSSSTALTYLKSMDS